MGSDFVSFDPISDLNGQREGGRERCFTSRWVLFISSCSHLQHRKGMMLSILWSSLYDFPFIFQETKGTPHAPVNTPGPTNVAVLAFSISEVNYIEVIGVLKSSSQYCRDWNLQKRAAVKHFHSIVTDCESQTFTFWANTFLLLETVLVLSVKIFTKCRIVVTEWVCHSILNPNFQKIITVCAVEIHSFSKE